MGNEAALWKKQHNPHIYIYTHIHGNTNIHILYQITENFYNFRHLILLIVNLILLMMSAIMWIKNGFKNF